MNKKRLILALGATASVAAPIAATISCSAWDDKSVVKVSNYNFSVDGEIKSLGDFGHALIKNHSLTAGQIIAVGDKKHTLSADDLAQFASMTQGDQGKALALVGQLVGLDEDGAQAFADTYNEELGSAHGGQKIDPAAITASGSTGSAIDPAALDLIRQMPTAKTGTTVSYTAYGTMPADAATGDVDKHGNNPLFATDADKRVFYVGDLISDKHATKGPWVVKGSGSMGYHSLFAYLKHGGAGTVAKPATDTLEADVTVVLTVGRFQYTRTLSGEDMKSYDALVAEYKTQMAGGLEPGQKDTQVQAKAVRWLNATLGVDDIDRQTTELWLSAGHDELGASEGTMRTDAADLKTWTIGDYADHKGIVELGGGSSHGFHTMFTMFKHPFGDSEYDKQNDIVPGDKVDFFFSKPAVGTSPAVQYETKFDITAKMVNDFRGAHKDFTSAFQAGELAQLLIEQINPSNTNEVTATTKTVQVKGKDKTALDQVTVVKAAALTKEELQLLAFKEVDGWLEVDGTEHTGGIGHRLPGEEKTFKVGVFADHHGAVEFGGGSSHGFHTLFGEAKHPQDSAKYDGDETLIVGDKIEFTYNVGAKMYVSKIELDTAALTAFDKIIKKIDATKTAGELVENIIDTLINDANTFEVTSLDKTATTAEMESIYADGKTAVKTNTVTDAFRKAIKDQVNTWLLADGTAHTAGIVGAAKPPAKTTK